MQKKIIALAVAGLVSAGAYAQSNVQIYGIIDYGYTYRGDKLSGTAYANNSSSNSRFDSGQSAGNRLGFKGVEDIGNGLKAVFVLERGFNSDDGTEPGGFNRQAYVGLAGNWGTLAGGKIYTPHYNLWSAVDPFGGTTVAKYQNVKQDIANGATGITGDGGLFDPVRVRNTIAYISPNWNGFSFVAAYSNNALGADVTTKTSTSTNTRTTVNGVTTDTTVNATSDNNRVGAIAANYTADNLMVGVSYHIIDAGGSTVTTTTNSTTRVTTTTNNSVDKVQNFSLGATYNFGVAKVAFAWAWDELQYKSAGLKDIGQNNFLLGATFPFGKHAVKASVNYSVGDGDYGDAYQIGVGYTYNFSKRTNFYAAYSFIDNDEDTATQIGRRAVTGDASNLGGIYEQAFQLGIKHSF